MSKNKLVLTIVCILVGLSLIFGLVFGIVIGVKNAKSVLEYEGVTMDEEVASFFVSYYKYQFISIISRDNPAVSDSAEFWASDYIGGQTYGEALKLYSERYLMEVAVANFLYDKYSPLTRAQKDKIDGVCDEVLTYKANGSVKEFNELAKPHGFDYKSFCRAAVMLYKAQYLRSVLYGLNGENLKNFRDECEEYYSRYSHVKLLFIRTEDKFLLDDEGNRVRDEDNKDITVPLTDAERARRLETIATIRTMIANYNEGKDPSMSPAMFDNYLKTVDEGDESMRNTGYYFCENAEYTKEFASKYSDIVLTAQSMEIGSYNEVATDFGVCFIYRYENTEGAYVDESPDGCFSDFYSDAADILFYELIEELVGEVTIKERMKNLKVCELPYNNLLVPRF